MPTPNKARSQVKRDTAAIAMGGGSTMVCVPLVPQYREADTEFRNPSE